MHLLKDSRNVTTYLFSLDYLSSGDSISRERERIAKEKEELLRKLDSNVALSHGISLPQPVSSSSQVIIFRHAK